MGQPDKREVQTFNLVDAARWLDEMANQLPMFDTHGKRPDVDRALADFVAACRAAHVKAKALLLQVTAGRPNDTSRN